MTPIYSSKAYLAQATSALTWASWYAKTDQPRSVRIEMANHEDAIAKAITTMIRQGMKSEEIAAATGVKEHFILGEMEAIAKAEAA